MVVDANEVTRRFADADGKLFVTLDSPQIRRARALNESLFERVRDNPKTRSDLFVTSKPKNRQSANIGNGLLGEWWTKIHLLGENIQIGRDVNLLGHGGIEIGRNVKIGDCVNIDTIGHPNNPVQRNTAFTGGPVIIKEGAQIGSGAILIAPRGKTLTIGKHAKIANGSVVKSDIADQTCVTGVLAKPTREPISCTFTVPDKSWEGFEIVNNTERSKEIFGDAADVKFPIYIKGSKYITVKGNHRLGINKRAVFDLQGPVTVATPFKMATDASLTVKSGAKIDIGKEAFLYMNAHVVADNPMTIGENSIIGAGAIINRNVEPNTIVGGRNKLIGHVGNDPLDTSIIQNWNDPTSLPPKVEAFQEFKKQLCSNLSFEEVKEQAIEADDVLCSYRTKEGFSHHM